MDHSEERNEVVKQAQSYIGTPYFHMGMQKHAGVDCGTFIHLAFRDAGLVEPLKLPYYPPDWHFHKEAETYVSILMNFCVEVPGPPERELLPGDIVMYRFGRVFSHGGIVEKWPFLIHAYFGLGVIRTDASIHGELLWINEKTAEQGKRRPIKYYCFKKWMD